MRCAPLAAVSLSVSVISALVGSLALPSPALAEGTIEPPLSLEQVELDGVRVLRATGRFVGEGPRARYRVPYLLVGRPSYPDALFDVSHFVAGPDMTRLIGREVVHERLQVAQASVGYALPFTVAFGPNTILDPSATDVFIEPSDGSDPADPDAQMARALEIMRDFAVALRTGAVPVFGRFQRVYITGASQASFMTNSLLVSGLTGDCGEPLVELAIPVVTSGPTPLDAVDAGLLPGTKILMVQSELERILDTPELRPQARHNRQVRIYEVPGSGHAFFDEVVVPPPPGLPDPCQTPVHYHNELRARFIDGVRWVRHGIDPLPSVLIKDAPRDPATGAFPADPVYGFPTGIARDDMLNASTVFARFDRHGNLRTSPAPRHPALAIGEATFIGIQDIPETPGIDFPALLGAGVDRDSIRSIGDPGFFATPAGYRLAFLDAAADLAESGIILPGDALDLVREAWRGGPFTLTENHFRSCSDD